MSGRRPTFDILFGIALPLVCFVADPGILRGDMALGPPMLRSVAAGIYVFIVPAMLLLAIWLAFRRGAILLAGPLLAGGVVALGIGVVLLPMSLLMSLALIGLLGLVPLGTALAFFRNGLAALRAARATAAPVLVGVVATVLAFAALGLPVLAQVSINERTRAALDAALSKDASREARAVARLKSFGWLAPVDEFVSAWEASIDPVERAHLERVWREVTGDSLTAGLVD